VTEPTVNLNTRYLGLSLDSPIVASASPLTGHLDDLVRLQQAGVGAVVLPSLFEEQIEYDALFVEGFDGSPVGAEAISGYHPQLDHLTDGPDHYLSLVEEAVRTLHIPVIASLNGTTPGSWATFASLLQDAGAAAIELNIYRVAVDPSVTGAEVEEQHVRLVADVRATIDLPLAVKIGPQFSSIANISQRLVDAGADGLVLFNRFYQPEINLDDLTVEPHLVLSTSEELRFALRWIAILRGQISCSLASTTGVHSVDDVVKCILAGSDVAMMTSAMLQHGPEHVAVVLAGVRRWFTDRGYQSVDQARGSLKQLSVPNPEAFERSNYAQTLRSFRR